MQRYFSNVIEKYEIYDITMSNLGKGFKTFPKIIWEKKEAKKNLKFFKYNNVQLCE